MKKPLIHGRDCQQVYREVKDGCFRKVLGKEALAARIHDFSYTARLAMGQGKLWGRVHLSTPPLSAIGTIHSRRKFPDMHSLAVKYLSYNNVVCATVTQSAINLCLRNSKLSTPAPASWKWLKFTAWNHTLSINLENFIFQKIIDHHAVHLKKSAGHLEFQT